MRDHNLGIHAVRHVQARLDVRIQGDRHHVDLRVCACVWHIRRLRVCVGHGCVHGRGTRLHHVVRGGIHVYDDHWLRVRLLWLWLCVVRWGRRMWVSWRLRMCRPWGR